MSSLMDLLKRSGIDARDIQTSSVNLKTVYDRPVSSSNEDENDKTPPRKIVGYQVQNMIRLVIRDVSQVGGLIEATVKSGANKIEDLSFSVADPQPVLRDLRKKALADVRSKAEEAVKEAGMTLGLPVSIEMEVAPQT
jgi:uncharacterized protein YggE